MLIDVLIIVSLILLNGVFAMTELAVVSSRKNRLQALAEKGNRSARIVMELKDDPSKFLSTVQIGITLIGIFSGTYSGVTLAEPLADHLGATFPELGLHADDLAIALVVTGVTYLSLVIGELVPKQVALRYADTVALAIAVPIYRLSLITKPVVHILDISNRLVLTLMRVKPEADNLVSSEDVRALIAESTESGQLEPEEQEMMERVMRLDDIPITAAMTHRKDIVWLEADESPESVLTKLKDTRHSRYPLYEKSVEHILGVVVVKDLALQLGGVEKFDLRSMAYKPLYIPESTTLLEALEEFKQSTANMALIIDEYGALEGIVTLKDMMEAIVGGLPEPAHREDYTASEREDGSWLIDGGLSVHEAEELTGVRGLDTGNYATIAGLMLHELRHIPKEGDILDWNGWRFEVLDMDGNRVDKVLMKKA